MFKTSLEGGEANRPRPHNNENSDGFQCEKPGRVTLRRAGLFSASGPMVQLAGGPVSPWRGRDIVITIAAWR
jgi:hypothetical protein